MMKLNGIIAPTILPAISGIITHQTNILGIISFISFIISVSPTNSVIHKGYIYLSLSISPYKNTYI